MSNVSKYIFGKNKLGRMKRTLECDSSTFKGSQRGAVLKCTNEWLLSHGMRKRSQIDSINGADISGLPYKRIIKILNEHIGADQPFETAFMIPEMEVCTVECFFRGKFCNDYIGFASDENDSNFIVSNIVSTDPNAQRLLSKSGIKLGVRVTKVKGILKSDKQKIQRHFANDKDCLRRLESGLFYRV